MSLRKPSNCNYHQFAVAFPADATLTVQGAHDDTVEALDARTRALYLEGISNGSVVADCKETGRHDVCCGQPIAGHTIMEVSTG